jgi:hypothetical protein
MRRSRFRPSHATLIAYVALFVALGGTALGAVVITSNSQVAKNTISGHRPPAGKHSNLIGGSVNGQDVADNSLTGGDISEGSLTGNARKLIYKASPSPQKTKLATAGPYTIKGRCFNDGIQLKTRLIANGPAGTADLMYDGTSNDNPNLGSSTTSTEFATPANTDFTIVGAVAEDPDHNRVAGTAMLRSGSELVQVDFDAVADSRNPRSCHIYGTTTRGT